MELRDDPELQRLWRVLHGIKREFGTRPVEASEILSRGYRANRAGDRALELALDEVAAFFRTPRMSARSLGKWLGARSFLVVGQLKVLPAGVRNGCTSWVVVQVAPSDFDDESG
jgi:hypothetical protein